MFRKEKIARHPEYNWEHKTVLGEQNIGLDFMYQQVPYLLTTSCCDIYIYILSRRATQTISHNLIFY